ncbi:MAG: histidine kinase [Lachnospiraceae bacterium]|jgi:two-component system sensor histidine kinase YesM|nr:histidine kinase [Lachnospiraceae bacterium]
MKKKIPPKSLKKKILLFMILCWAVPVTVFFAFTTVSYHQGIVGKAERLMEEELQNIVSFASIRIGDAVSLCQRPSYEKTWENAWKSYENGSNTRNEYLQEVNTSLKGKFYQDERFNMYAYYCYGSGSPDCFSSRTGISYNSYLEEIQPGLEDIIAMDSSYSYVRVTEGRMFIIRNLYTTVDYVRFGTLVVELNKYKVFQDVSQDVRENMFICIGSGSDILELGIPKEQEKEEMAARLLKQYDSGKRERMDWIRDRNYTGCLYQKQYDTYHMGAVLLAERAELYSSLYEFYTIAFLLMILFVPLVYYGVDFLRRHIQVPIGQIMQASKRVEAGEMGAMVEGEMPNAEFQYMKERFDSMSGQVRCLFEYAYDEKLARKDAQIQALQAQINPHFLNNTLEMMNWQARMSGDTVIPKMIEALGTVLDYRMNRAQVKEIHLTEELRCVNAYFYIMSMRFGQRLRIEQEIDEELRYLMVPPLILQPLVENAVVHGVEVMANGLIRLNVYHDREHVYLEVRNTGKEMTEEAKKKIEAILEGTEAQIPKEPGRHTSIGIQNVNRRIRLMYGEEYGLTIGQEADFETVSRITIPYEKRQEEKSAKERNLVEEELKNIARLNK